MRRPAHRGQRGFMLVLTMWILVGIAIAAAYFADRVQNSLRLATQRQSGNDALVALSDTRAEMLFRLATTPMTPYGLGPLPQAIRLDDRPYRDGSVILRMQDARGLLSLNSATDEQLQRLLRTLGVPDDRQASLIDSLRDYIDEDSLQRLNGAEAETYRAAGRAGLPRNAPLTSPLELRQVWGWAEQSALWGKEGLLDLASVETRSIINPNTAPWQVLTALPSVTPDVARAIIARREVEPVNAAWLDRMLGTQLDTMMSPVSPLPAHAVRLTLRAPGLPWGLRYNVQLTPTGAEAPWNVVYFHRIEAELAQGPASNPPTSAHASDPPSLPPRAALPTAAPFLLPN